MDRDIHTMSLFAPKLAPNGVTFMNNLKHANEVTLDTCTVKILGVGLSNYVNTSQYYYGTRSVIDFCLRVAIVSGSSHSLCLPPYQSHCCPLHQHMMMVGGIYAVQSRLIAEEGWDAH